MANELQQVLDEIKLEKETYLRPHNLKDQVTLLGVTGSFRGLSHNAIFSIEQDDEGNLWSVSNYEEIEDTPYEIDKDGNFIVYQLEDDFSQYIMENNDLEVIF